jgi:hypothetical protein
VRLHRALFRGGLLPIGGDRAWGNERVPPGERAGLGGPLDRAVLPRAALLDFIEVGPRRARPPPSTPEAGPPVPRA